MINLNYSNYPKKTFINESTKTDVLNDIKKSIDQSDIILISKLGNLRSSLNNDNLNIKNIRQQIQELSEYNKVENFNYLCNLLKPEKAKGCRIPSQIPVPSCSFQLHNSITLKTNSSGNVAFIMNPAFLASTLTKGLKLPGASGENDTYIDKYLTTAWVNNHDSLTGSASNNNWTAVDIGQTIPAVYDQFRLVSASLVVKYIGRLDNVQGLVGGAIFFDDNSALGGSVQIKSGQGQYDPAGDSEPTVCGDLEKYGNFDLANDSFYQCQNMTLEGIREIYFPIDASFEDYRRVMDNDTAIDGMVTDKGVELIAPDNLYKSGFNWFFYSTNAPASSNCFKLDIYCNFECLPNAEFLNYIPISLSPFIVPAEEKKRALLIAHNKPIMKSDENTYDEIAPINVFNKLSNKFVSGLPGFEKLKAYGLMTAIPGLKPGLALAGSMMQSNMMFDDY